MKTKSTVLTKQERDALILGATQSNGQFLSSSEIAQRLGVSVARVKTLMCQACVKLGAQSRYEAIFFATIRGEISLKKLFSPDELAEIFSSLGPDMLRRIAHLVRQELEHGHLPENGEQIIRTDRRQDTILTKRERDVLILVARGLTNRDIADRLCISVDAVRTFLYRAYAKLGARRGGDAFMLALKQREISLSEFFSPDELAELLSPLGPDMLKRIAHLVRQEQEHGHLPGKDEQIIRTDRRQDTILTKRERDVLILVPRGLTNKDIADRLCISISAVRTFLYRACAKLGAHTRGDAFMLALKQREIGIGEIVSLNETVQLLAPLGTETIEKMAQLVARKLGREPIPTGS